MSRQKKSNGFTLVEMLVVMAIIVLAVGMAIPAIRFMTGSRSQEGAQNVISGIIGFARNDAVGMQQVRGVLFVLDDDDRVKAYEVQPSADSQATATDVPGVIYLDFVPDRDPVTLPVGLRLWTLNDVDVNAPRFNGYPYLGMNPASDFGPSAVRTDRRLGGVILFGADGRLRTSRYGFRFATHVSGGGMVSTSLGQFVAADPSSTVTPAIWPATNNGTSVLYASIGLCLCDREEMQTNIAPGAEGDDDASPSTVAKYFDTFSTPLFVNRYSGALMAGQ